MKSRSAADGTTGLLRVGCGKSPVGSKVEPAMVQARLAPRRWLDTQRRMLNRRLALVQVEHMTLHPQAPPAFGRAEALDRLREELAAEARRKAARRDPNG